MPSLSIEKNLLITPLYSVGVSCNGPRLLHSVLVNLIADLHFWGYSQAIFYFLPVKIKSNYLTKIVEGKHMKCIERFLK